MNLRNDNRPPITISMTISNFGDATIYITNNGSTPSPTCYQWASTGVVNIRNVVTIKPTDIGYCNNCTYNIAVSSSSYVVYSINVVYGELPTQLATGQPFSASVASGQYKYFEAYAGYFTNDINVQITTYAGQVNLYVSIY